MERDMRNNITITITLLLTACVAAPVDLGLVPDCAESGESGDSGDGIDQRPINDAAGPAPDDGPGCVTIGHPSECQEQTPGLWVCCDPDGCHTFLGEPRCEGVPTTCCPA